MNILITGGGGFLGQKLCAALRAQYPHAALALSDLSLSHSGFIDDTQVQHLAGDFTQPATLESIAAFLPDVVYHLAAVVSGQAEQEFDTGMRINFHGTLGLLETLRQLNKRPRFVFSSSVAVYGGTLPSICTDETSACPGNSYGAQKAACEIMINDYTRKGFVDGLSLRLPTVVVRPGKPNAAASSFASGIIREPVHGERAVCPVNPNSALWLTSPKTVIANLTHALDINMPDLNGNTILPLPGISVSVGEMLDILERKTSSEIRSLVDMKPDPLIQKIVNDWPANFHLERSPFLGFHADSSFSDVVDQYIDSTNP